MIAKKRIIEQKKISEAEIFDNEKAAKNNTQLIILSEKNQKLSKEQEMFNRLSQKIETEQRLLNSDKLLYESIFLYYSDNIVIEKTALAERYIESAKNLAQSLSEMKFSKIEEKKVKQTIVEICSQAFNVIEIDEDIEKFYNQFSKKTYQEEIREEAELWDKIFSPNFNLFGKNDEDEYDDELLEEENRRRDKKTSTKNERTTKQELLREEAQKQTEAFQAKTLRSIYVSLAKALHPDSNIEKEDLEQQQREELMKKVTVAYENKDLTMLLKLELEWVVTERNHLSTLTEQKLKLYIESLKKQHQELKVERFMLKRHPRYKEIFDYLCRSEKKSKIEINIAKSAIINEREKIEKRINSILLSKDNVFKFIKYMEDYFEEQENNGSYFPFY